MVTQNSKNLIFLIDDDISFCNLLTLLLEKENLNIKCFYSIDDALKALKNEVPDLILLDIALPKINGFSGLLEIKKILQEKAPPILFITNLDYTENGQKIDENLVQNLGANGLIHKTENLQDVLKKIKNFLSCSL